MKRTRRITLDVTYDPTEHSDPTTWDWNAMTDSDPYHPVTVVSPANTTDCPKAIIVGNPVDGITVYATTLGDAGEIDPDMFGEDDPWWITDLHTMPGDPDGNDPYQIADTALGRTLMDTDHD